MSFRYEEDTWYANPPNHTAPYIPENFKEIYAKLDKNNRKIETSKKWNNKY